jgi:hypothetical protein
MNKNTQFTEPFPDFNSDKYWEQISYSKDNYIKNYKPAS